MSPDQTFTYRGRSLEELVPRIRQELGDDAVIVARRETTSGGVGGFFAKREIEVEVRPGESARAAGLRPAGDDEAASAAARAFAQQLAEAQERQQGGGPAPATSPEVDALPSSPDMTVDDLFPAAPPAQAHGLAALFNAGKEPEPEAPAPEVEQEPASGIPEPEGPITFEWPAVRRAEEPEVHAAPAPAHEPEPSFAPEAEPPFEPPVVEQPTGMFDYVGVEPATVEPPRAEGAAEVVPSHAGFPPAVEDAVAHLEEHGLRPELADAIAEEAMAALLPLLPSADPKDLVVDALARRIPLHPLRRGAGVLGFVGSGGAGKTRCVARLAAAHARHGALPVAVVALRSPDGGAELERLLAPYGVTLHAVDSGAEGAARIAALRGDSIVIVDTPGVSPRSSSELRALRLELDALAPDELHLTVPATVGPAAARELVRGVRELGVGALTVTHTDETEMLGTVIGLAIDCSLPMSFLARGQAVEAGLRPADARELARELLP